VHATDPLPRTNGTETITVRRITTGVVRARRASRGALRYLIDDWEDDVLPVNAYLVEHPAGTLLFDAGQSADAAVPGYFPRWHPFLRLARFELEASEEAGAQVDPASVTWVLLSHLHTDHIGGLAPFRSAQVIVGATEWRRAVGVRGRLRGYVPQHWPRGLTPTLVTPDGEPLGPFASSLDLAGDGTLLIVPTPGHTPGHLSLVVRGSEHTWLLAGDLVHTAGELETGQPSIARWCVSEHVVVLTAHNSDDAGAPLRSIRTP
jgi:glyoxylase-like metal-dependent hydrolase (beta-lactamase superfamily II)